MVWTGEVFVSGPTLESQWKLIADGIVQYWISRIVFVFVHEVLLRGFEKFMVA